jgi:hypothetical protein
VVASISEATTPWLKSTFYGILWWFRVARNIQEETAAIHDVFSILMPKFAVFLQK